MFAAQGERGGFQADGNGRMWVEIKTLKNPYGFEKSHAKFSNLKNFRKGLNNISTTKGDFSVDKHDG